MDSQGEWRLKQLPPHMKRLHKRQMRAIREEREERDQTQVQPANAAPSREPSPTSAASGLYD
jgi:hypothetical protein